MERSCQTEFHNTTHRGTQTSPSSYEGTCINFLTECGYSIVPPANATWRMQRVRCPKTSFDDLILDLHPERELLSTNPLPSVSKPSSRKATPLPHLSTPPAPDQPQPPLTPVTPKDRPQPGTSSSTISTLFKSFHFFPERREGHGPKKICTTLDRTFGITSDKAIRALKMPMEERASKKNKKSTRGRGTGKKRKTPHISSSENDSDADEPGYVQQQSSDDDLDLEPDPHNLCIKMPLTDPGIDSWVGVQVEKVATTSKGRQHKPFEIYIGKVSYHFSHNESLHFDFKFNLYFA